MPTSPEIINLVYDILKQAPALAQIKEWNKANSLLTLASPGGSIGIQKEIYDAYTREEDEVTARLSILLWVKNIQPAAGEAEVRALAQTVRQVLVNNRTLGGLADDSYVNSIEYATADGGKSILLHLAEIDFQVRYYSDRLAIEQVPPVERIQSELETD